VFASYLISFYYNVIISWALVYFFSGFYNPLPWSTQYADDLNHKDCAMPVTQEYFYKDILHTINDDCTAYNTSDTMGGESRFQWQVWLAQLFVWLVVFICVFKGVKLTSKIVWVTVPLPLIFVLIMTLNGFTLPGCGTGFRMYLKGEVDGEAPDLREKLSNAGMWSEACAQIFFSLGVCLGIMVSYSSYNPVKAPIIKNAITVSCFNCSFSFLAGFSVFATVGYLKFINSPVSDEVSSLGLAFVAYPAAIDTIAGSNFWILMFTLTLFTLGIDTSFSIVEATCTVIQDTEIGKRLSKMKLAALLCIIGAIGSTVFCFNWGFTFFDIVDHYLNVYLVLLMGILQAVACSWIHGLDDALATGAKASVWVLLGGYFGLLIPLALLAYFAFPNDSWVAIPVFWAYFIVISAISFAISRLPFKTWYREIFFAGARPIALKMMSLSTTPYTPIWSEFFQVYWCFSIKFIFPWAIWWLLVMTAAKDIEIPYSDYNVGWQVIGLMIPVFGVILFLLPLIFFKGSADGTFKKAFRVTAEPTAEETELIRVAAKVEPVDTAAAAPQALSKEIDTVIVE
jgi:SNF family Na+-dependent transporter